MVLPTTDVIKQEKYRRFLNCSQDLYEYFVNGKRNINLRTVKEDEAKNKDNKPPWRSTGASNLPSYTKPSKYQLNSNIKAKVYTGLTEKPKPSEKEKEKKEEILSLSEHEFAIDQNGDIIIQPIGT